MYDNVIRQLVEIRNCTHAECARYIRATYNVNRGASEANIALYCSKHGIHRQDVRKMSDRVIAETITNCVYQTGPTYDRRMVTG